MNNFCITNRFSIYDNNFDLDYYTQQYIEQSSSSLNSSSASSTNTDNDEADHCTTPTIETSEWDKINSILEAVEYILEHDEAFNSTSKSLYDNNNTSNTCRYKTIEEFLLNLNLSRYLTNFLNNGYDDINHVNGIITKEDLLLIGIQDRILIERVLNEMKYLPQQQNLHRQYKSVYELLVDLNLTKYSEIIHKKHIDTIASLKKMWDIEFITVLNIRPIGHRKRLLHALHTNEANCQQSSNGLKRLKSVTFSDKIDICDKQQDEEYTNQNILKQTVKTHCSNSSSNISSYLKEYKTVKTIWKHDATKIINDMCNYDVKYLGSSAVNKLYSDKNPIKYAIDRLKNSTKQSPYESPSVILSISINGVQLLHTDTKTMLWNHDMKYINSVCQDQDELNYFALITKTNPAEYHYCHIFKCQNAKVSTEIILTIGQAFDEAYRIFLQNVTNHAL